MRILSPGVLVVLGAPSSESDEGIALSHYVGVAISGVWCSEKTPTTITSVDSV